MKEKHRKAMKLFQEALLIKDDVEQFKKFLSQALDLENEVISNYEGETNVMTKSVLNLSGASIAYNLKNFSEVYHLVSKGINSDIPYQIFSDMLGLVLNKSQQEFAQSDDAYTRALAPAGSGKTTTLLWKCLDDALLTNKKNKYLIFTFTRVARDELRDRISTLNEFKPIKNITRIETLNQWGNSYIKGIKDGLQLKTSKQDFFYLINNNLRPLWDKQPVLAKLKNLTYRYREVVNIFGELKTLGFRHNHKKSDFFGEFKNHHEWLEENNLSKYFKEKVYNPVVELELVDFSKKNEFDRLKPFLEFWVKSTNSLWEQSLITLEDQKYWAFIKLIEQYPEDKFFPGAQRYNHILIDEFQDINPLDLFLIKKLNELNKSKLTIVGDDDQAIYEWRASSPNFILYPTRYFNQDFKTHILDVNYRSPKNIVDLSQKLIKNNIRRVEKEVVPFSFESAEIIVKKYNEHNESIQFINDLAKEYFNSNGKEKLAIISRKRAQLIPIQITLTSNNIGYFAKEDLNVLLSQAFSDLKKLLEIIAEKNNRKSSEKVVAELLLFCNNVHRYPLKKTEYESLRFFLMGKSPKTFMQALNTLLEFKGQLKGKNGDSFYKPISEVVSCFTVSEAIFLIGEKLEGLQKHYAKSEDDIFYKDPPFAYMVEYAKKYEDDFWKFIDHVENAISKMTIFDEHDEESDEGIKSNVHLMTALRAKGKEFETVVILDVNDGIWPIKFAEDDYELEQERRLFYVAMTRTKKRLIFITLDEMFGKKLNPCPYLEEMGLI